MDFTKFDDGFFCINEINGFLPKADPLEVLPEQFSILQHILDNIPEYIKSMEVMEQAVQALPNYLEQAKSASTDVFQMQALFRGYAILTSAYLLQSSHLNQVDGMYGKAKTVLPANIVQPFEYVAEQLNVFPFLDYHYAYSSGNYVKKDKTLPPDEVFNYTNLKLACSFSGTQDETGFIMLHVDIISKTNKLIGGIKTYFDPSTNKKLLGLTQVLEASKEINARRIQMWNASNYKNYNNFRAFIMGICGNTQLFGEGVVYEGSIDLSIRTYRGQTGAQDDTIPTLDIFTGVIKYYPENELTKYLLDLRRYRPVVFQEFFKELECHTINFRDLDVECKKVLYLILAEIYKFRNGHWQFVQKYILENTRYATATGGTPITTWIPNQIGAVLKYMFDVLFEIPDVDFFNEHSDILFSRISILKQQQAELARIDYSPVAVYESGKQFNEVDLSTVNKSKGVCPYSHH